MTERLLRFGRQRTSEACHNNKERSEKTSGKKKDFFLLFLFWSAERVEAKNLPLFKKKKLKSCIKLGFQLNNEKCGRWDLNPHDCNSHKILSLARLPVPTLPHVTVFRPSERYITTDQKECQQKNIIIL